MSTWRQHFRWSSLAIFAAVVSALSSLSFGGGPANPFLHQIKQPDGSTFLARLRGDENQGWLETSDGYSIVKNDETGFYEYAEKASSGMLVSSGLRVLQIKQPDGKAFSAAWRCAGEGRKVLETPDGKPIIKNDSGFYVYAVKAPNGMLVPGADLPGVYPKGSEEKPERLPQSNGEVSPE
jgi:hypothetical protein